MNYRITPATLVMWNARYGYEESGNANSRNIVARTGLQLTQIFTPRLQGTLTVNLLRSEVKTTTSIPASTSAAGVTTPSSTLNTDTVQDTVDASAGLYYTYDRHWSFNLTYSYTMGIGPTNFDDYYRQRVFLGASYQF